MKKLMNLLVLSCQKATLLIEKGHVSSLGFMDRIQLSIHLRICKHCSNYQKQSLLIENVLNSAKPKKIQASDLKLSELGKTRIKKAIDDNLNNY